MYRMKMNDVSIIVAAKQNNLKAVKELLDMNVDADSTNDSFTGDAAMHFAIKHNNYEMVKWLIAAGANLNFKQNYSFALGSNFPRYFEHHERHEILALLIKCGARFEGWENKGGLAA